MAVPFNPPDFAFGQFVFPLVQRLRVYAVKFAVKRGITLPLPPRTRRLQQDREKLDADPFSGWLFVFRSRSATSIRVLAYDGQGFWLAQKRLSKGRFLWWPKAEGASRAIEAYQAQLLLAAGNPDTQAAPMWRRVS